jgi:hypothetical protein
MDDANHACTLAGFATWCDRLTEAGYELVAEAVMSEVVCSMHQLNFLPGASVIDRLRRADVVVWLDGAQYVRHGFVNRNRFPDGHWMTVPVNEHDTFSPINRVRIADPGGRACAKIARTLEHRLGAPRRPYAAELRKPYRLLAGLNHALIVTSSPTSASRSSTASSRSSTPSRRAGRDRGRPPGVACP